MLLLQKTTLKINFLIKKKAKDRNIHNLTFSVNPNPTIKMPPPPVAPRVSSLTPRSSNSSLQPPPVTPRSSQLALNTFDNKQSKPITYSKSVKPTSSRAAEEANSFCKKKIICWNNKKNA